jgi:DNA-binding IclR family transcriptional regulator
VAVRGSGGLLRKQGPSKRKERLDRVIHTPYATKLPPTTKLQMLSSVDRALAILQFLSTQEKGVSAVAISVATKTDKSMVSRVLMTLEHQKYVVRSAAGEYFLGIKFISMGILQLEITGLFQLCNPVLEKIAEESGELVQFAIADNDDIYYVAKADGKERVRVMPRLGTRAPFHATAVGKVWLASLPEERALKVALSAGLESFTPTTIRTVAQLREELDRVRELGYGLNDEEMFTGVRGIAVPIHSRDEVSVSGALTIVAAAFRMSKEKAISYLPLLRKEADNLRGVECLRRPQDALAPETATQQVAI